MKSTLKPQFMFPGVLHVSQIKNLPNQYSRKSCFIPILDQSSFENIPDAAFYTFFKTDVGSFSCNLQPGCVLINRPRNIISESTKNFTDSSLLIIHSSDQNLAFALNENCDPTVRSDMIQGLDRIVNEKVKLHDVVSPAITFPVNSRNLGTWQGLYTISTNSTISKYQIFSASLNPTRTFKTTINTTRGSNKVSLPQNLTSSGVLYAITLHTSCSLALLSESEAATRENELSKTVPEKWNDEFFEHTYEGPDDMPAHLKCAIQGAETSVAIQNGKIIGEEEFFLIEHRDHRSLRKVVFYLFEN